jgi:hypothetical protein
MIDAANIRKVTLHKGFPHVSFEVHLLHERDVATFIEAQEKLHVNPGVNPHNLNRTSPMTYLTVEKIDHTRDASYWWCNPKLTDTRDGTGAVLIGWQEVESKHYPIPEYLLPKDDKADEPIMLTVATDDK